MVDPENWQPFANRNSHLVIDLAIAMPTHDVLDVPGRHGLFDHLIKCE